MAKHRIDLDEERLGPNRAELGTTSIKDTVNEALQVTMQRKTRISAALDRLGAADLDDRADAWS